MLRSTEVEPLAVVDAEISRRGEFVRGFDPLRDHPGTRLVGKAHKRTGEGPADRVGAD